MTNYIEIAKKIIAEGYKVAGVRSIEEDEVYTIGDIARESYEWDLAEDCSTYHTTGLTAGGTCATQIDIDTMYYESDDEVAEMAAKIEKVVAENKCYGGDQVIIAGYDYCTEYDLTDDNEVRIVEAEILAVL